MPMIKKRFFCINVVYPHGGGAYNCDALSHPPLFIKRTINDFHLYVVSGLDRTSISGVLMGRRGITNDEY